MAQDKAEQCAKLLWSTVDLLSTFIRKVNAITTVSTLFTVFIYSVGITFIENNTINNLKKARLGSGCKGFLYVILWVCFSL